MEIKDDEMFVFELPFGAAKIIVAALGKLPMETVEPLVMNLRSQVDKQISAKQDTAQSE